MTRNGRTIRHSDNMNPTIQSGTGRSATMQFIVGSSVRAHGPVRRSALRVAGTMLVALSACGAHAQGYPERAVKIVVPYAPGNPLDTPTRMIAGKLSQIWGQPVVLENRTGPTLISGIDVVAKSAPDGHVLLSGTPAVVQAPALVKNLPYDTLRDLAPVTKLIDAYNIFVVGSAVPANTLPEFIAAARANPGRYSFGSSGTATTAHLLVARLNFDHASEITHVAFKGSAAAYRALLQGEVSAAVLSLSTVTPQLAAGKLKALGVIGGARAPAAPGIPTFDEAGVRGFSAVGFWQGIFTRNGTPEPVLNRIAADIGKAMRSEELEAYYRSNGSTLVLNTPAEFRDIVNREVSYWLDLVRTTGVKLD